MRLLSAIVWFLWLQACFLVAVASVFWTMLMKTHAKAVQTQQRADLIAPVAKTANTASATATTANTTANTASTNATSALGKLTNIGSASNMGSLGSFATFGGATDGTTLKSNINDTVGYCNTLATQINAAAARLNTIYADAS